MSVILLFSYRVHLIIWVKSLSDPKRLAAEVRPRTFDSFRWGSCARYNINTTAVLSPCPPTPTTITHITPTWIT